MQNDLILIVKENYKKDLICWKGRLDTKGNLSYSFSALADLLLKPLLPASPWFIYDPQVIIP